MWVEIYQPLPPKYPLHPTQVHHCGEALPGFESCSHIEDLRVLDAMGKGLQSGFPVCTMGPLYNEA